MKFLLSIFMVFSLSYSEMKVVDYQTLKPHLKNKEKVVVTNFWASWCGPCVHELPFFAEVQERLKKENKEVEFVFVSLDFASRKDKSEELFNSKSLNGKSFLLKDDPDFWINQIDSTWQGNIPFTLINTPDGDSLKIDNEFASAEDLYNTLKQYLK